MPNSLSQEGKSEEAITIVYKTVFLEFEHEINGNKSLRGQGPSTLLRDGSRVVSHYIFFLNRKYSLFSIYEIDILLKTFHKIKLVNQEVILHTKLRKWGEGCMHGPEKVHKVIDICSLKIFCRVY
jgi:hypothetical protein